MTFLEYKHPIHKNYRVRIDNKSFKLILAYNGWKPGDRLMFTNKKWATIEHWYWLPRQTHKLWNCLKKIVKTLVRLLK